MLFDFIFYIYFLEECLSAINVRRASYNGSIITYDPILSAEALIIANSIRDNGKNSHTQAVDESIYCSPQYNLFQENCTEAVSFW